MHEEQNNAPVKTVRSNRQEANFPNLEEKENLKQFYLAQSRRLCPTVSVDRSELQRLGALHHKIKHFIKALTNLDRSWENGMPEMQKACLHFFSLQNSPRTECQKIFEEWAKWSNFLISASCYHGFVYAGLRVGCHSHGSPLPLVPAIATSCNGYFCWGLFHMIGAKKKYGSVQAAMNTWRDYMVSMGFGYPLGVDLPGEKRGMIPNAAYYDKNYRGSWNGLTIISISIGQGEVTATPLQIANLGATIANRGYYITPHVVKEVEDEPLDTLYTTKHYTKVSREHYQTVVEGMRSAVLGGTCRSANIPGIEVCGKTGTAQNRGKDHSAFMGFAPMNDPKIAVVVYVENGGWGATYGVPIGALIMEKYLKGELSPESEAKAAEIQNRRIDYGIHER